LSPPFLHIFFSIQMKNKFYSKIDSIFFLLLAISAVIWFQDVIFYKNVFCNSDLARYFYPLREFGTEAIRNLRIPLWNPHILCGTPFLATLQPNVFYPLSIVYYLHPSFIQAFNLYIIIHFMLAGTFMYLLMRYWRFSYIAAAISAIVFTFGGFLTSVIIMNTSMSSFIWIPLIILFFDKALRTSSLLSVILCGVFFAIQFLGGNPDFLYGTIWLVFFYMLGYLWIHRNEGYRLFIRAVIYFLIINILWILIDAVQILPTLELLLCSHRSGGSKFETITRWSMSPIEIVSFVIPYIKGNISVVQGPLDPQKWLISFYVSIAALVFSIIGLFVVWNVKNRKTTENRHKVIAESDFLVNKKRLFIFFWMMLIFSVILALGYFTPLYNILYKFIPGFRYIRYPVKFLFLGVFSFSVLTGMGYEMVVKLKDEAKKQSIVRNLIRINTFFAILLALFFFYWDRIRDYVIKTFSPEIKSGAYISRKVIYTFLSNSMYITHFFIMFTLIAILITSFYNKIIQKRTFAILIFLIIFADLYNANAGLVKTSPINLFTTTPKSMELVKQHKELFRAYQTKDIWEINKKIFGWNYGLGIQERKATFMSNSSMQYRISDILGYDSIIRKVPMDLILFTRELPIEKQYKIIGLLNGLYIVSTEPKGGEIIYKGNLSVGKILYKDRHYEHFYILKNPYFMERAFLSEHATVLKNKQDIFGVFKLIDFDPREVVILTEIPPPAFLAASKNSQNKDRLPQSVEYVNITSYKPEEVIIEAQTNAPKWLVLSDSYYPGWKVFVDGKEDKIYEANCIMRAVHLLPGFHKIRFVYDPLSFKIGLAISLVTILSLVLIYFGIRHKRFK